MIAELSSYALADFLMFSVDAYQRLYQRYNAAIWPGQLLIIALSVLLLPWIQRPTPANGRWLCWLLGLSWGGIAWGFMLRYYAEINLAAPWFAWAFALQALLLIGLGSAGRPVLDGRRNRSARIGLGLLLFAMMAWPLLGLLMGRPWTGMELWLLSPDPTALGTLGILLMLRARLASLLAVIPLLWLVVSGLTHLAMAQGIGLLHLSLALLIALLLLSSRLRDA